MAKDTGIKRLVVCALLVAMGVALGVYVSIPVFTLGAYSVKIGFTVLPVILAGVLFGPLYGGIAGGLVDVLQVLIRPLGAYLPWFTITNVLIGAIPGLFFRKGQPVTLRRAFAAVFSGQVLASVLLNTLFIMQINGLPLLAVLPPRAINQAVMIPLYSFLVYYLVPVIEKISKLRRVAA